MNRLWYLDDELVIFITIIHKAKEYGYNPESGILLTSEASRILEKNGHKVECKEEH